MRVLFALAASFVAMSLGGCPSFEKPTASVADAKVASVDFNGAVVDVTITLENKNKVPLFADHLSFDGSIEGAPVVHSTLTQRVTLPAQGKADVKVPLRFVYKELKGAKAAMEGKKRWNYVVTGEIGFAPYESLLITVPFETDGDLPAPQLPSVTVSKARLEDVSMKDMTIVADVAVKNPNPFALPAGSVEGTITVGGQATPVRLAVPRTASETTTTVTLRQSVSLAKAASVAASIVAGKRVTAAVDAEMAFGERRQPVKATLTLQR